MFVLESSPGAIVIPELEIQEFWLIIALTLCGVFLGSTITFFLTTLYCCARAKRFKHRIPYEKVYASLPTMYNPRPRRRIGAWKNWEKLFRKKKRSSSSIGEDEDKQASEKTYRSERSERHLPFHEQKTSSILPILRISNFRPTRNRSYMKEAEAFSTIPQSGDDNYDEGDETDAEEPTYDSLDQFHERIMQERENAAQDFAQYQQSQLKEFERRQQKVWNQMQSEANQIFHARHQYPENPHQQRANKQIPEEVPLKVMAKKTHQDSENTGEEKKKTTKKAYETWI